MDDSDTSGSGGWRRSALVVAGLVLMISVIGCGRTATDSSDDFWVLVPNGREIARRFESVQDAQLAALAASHRDESKRVQKLIDDRKRQVALPAQNEDAELDRLVVQGLTAHAAFADARVESAQRLRRRIKTIPDQDLQRELQAVMAGRQGVLFGALDLPLSDLRASLQAEQQRRLRGGQK